MRLSKFIAECKEPILVQWESFARTIQLPGPEASVSDLRDHASQMLDVIAADLESPQTALQQNLKSVGRAPPHQVESYAEQHASQRLAAGFTINQMVSEYRALRASVLKLWAAVSHEGLDTDPEDVTRFNEAVDQALAESVARFSAINADVIETERLRLEAVLQAAPVGICLADQDGQIVLANAENRRIWGDHPMSACADAYERWRGWWADGSARDGQMVEAHEWAVARALQGEEAPADLVEIEPFGDASQRKTILVRSAPIRDLAAKIVGAVETQVDITAHLRTAAALAESEAKFRTMAETMPQMLWSCRPDGFHDYYNQRWYDFTGTSAQNGRGLEWNGVLHAEDHDRAWTAWRRCLETGEAYEILYRLRHCSGEYRWALTRALPVRNESGQITRWMGTCTDIHDQKLAEQDLERQSALKDQFLATLAHELRNPLAPISTAAQLLLRANPDAKRVRQVGEIVQRQVKLMTELVDDLLDVARVTRGLADLEQQNVDLKLVVRDAIEQINPLIDSRKHQLNVRMSAGPATVVGDRSRLVQVVANLLNNAAKYTPHGGNIELGLDVDEAEVRLHVIDNGSGIEPTLLPHVFELFSQGERTPDRSQGGLGLGLSLAQHVTHLHRGRITAASEGSGRGSTFTVALPKRSLPSTSAMESDIDDGPATAVVPRTILVVDDNADAGESLAYLLVAGGHQARFVESAAKALSSSNTDGVEVFILDIGLPDMDGYELARRLRAQPGTRNAVLIALTGYGQAHDRVLARAAGFDHHFVKPVNMTMLDEALAALPRQG